MKHEEIEKKLLSVGFIKTPLKGLPQFTNKYQYIMDDFWILYYQADYKLLLYQGMDLKFNIRNIEKEPNHNYSLSEVTEEQLSEILIWIREQKFKQLLD